MHRKWRVIILKQGRKYLQRLPQKDCWRILDVLDQLQNNPANVDIKPLGGRPEWSLRMGDLRILMRFNSVKREIVITRIGRRGDVYK